MLAIILSVNSLNNLEIAIFTSTPLYLLVLDASDKLLIILLFIIFKLSDR